MKHQPGAQMADLGNLSKDQLKSIIERIEHVESEIKTLQDDRKDIYAEAKGNGYDAKALRAVVRIRKMDAEDRQAQEALLETYLHALGMI